MFGSEALEPGCYRSAVAEARRAQWKPATGVMTAMAVLDDTQGNTLAQVEAAIRLGRNRVPSDFENGTLYLGRLSPAGKVLAAEERWQDHLVFTVSFPRMTPFSPGGAAVRVFPYDHLAALATWAAKLEGIPEGVDRLLGQAALGAATDAEMLDAQGLEPLDEHQRLAVEACARRSVLLWGPPGTGKTYTLAAAVAAMRRRGWRVAVVALSNAAVDVATLAIDTACSRLGQPLAPGELVRLGTPRHPALESEERGHLLAFQRELRALTRKLASARVSLAGTVRRIRKAAACGQPVPEKALRLRASLLELIRNAEAERRKLMKSWVEDARILCSTAASYVLLPAAPRMDAMVVDEGSQMPLALLYYLAAQDPERLHVVGDPMQLPPIVPAVPLRCGRTAEHVRVLFGLSRFGMAGLDPNRADFQTKLGELEARGALVPLLRQRRMAPEIGRMVSDLAYGGRLRHAAPEAPPALSADFLPPARLVHVVAPGSGTATSSHRQAELTRRVVRALPLAPVAPGEAAVLVLTPFRKQEKILTDLLGGMAGIRVLTIHKAQGSEAPCVVLDVPAPENPFLDNPGEALFLWNVAFSRARERLILVAPRSVAANRWAGRVLPRFQSVHPR